MHRVSSGGGPLETIAVEHLRGVVVLGFYPAHLVGTAQVVSHQRAQQGDEVGIIHHPFQGLLKFVSLHMLQCDASVSKAVQYIGKVRVVNVVRMEYCTILRGHSQQHDGMGNIVDGRKLEGLTKCIIGHHTDDDVGSKQCQEVVGIEVDLELAVLLTGREVAHTHDFGIETVIENGIEHQFLGLELGIDVLVGVDVLSEPQILFGELDIRSRHTIDTQARNAGLGDVDETRTGAQAKSDEVAHALDVDQFDVVTGREVFHVGHAIDNGEALTVEGVEGSGLGDFSGKGGDALVETFERIIVAKVIEEHRLEAAHRVFTPMNAQRAEDVAVVRREQLVEDVHAQISRGAREQYVSKGWRSPSRKACRLFLFS